MACRILASLEIQTVEKPMSDPKMSIDADAWGLTFDEFSAAMVELGNAARNWSRAYSQPDEAPGMTLDELIDNIDEFLLKVDQPGEPND